MKAINFHIVIPGSRYARPGMTHLKYEVLQP
jgi:hypothetical protein